MFFLLMLEFKYLTYAFFQILDYGLILHPGSYLRELWNAMDMLVVSCAITSAVMDVSVMFVADTEIVGIGSKAIGRYLVVIIFRKFLVFFCISVS